MDNNLLLFDKFQKLNNKKVLIATSTGVDSTVLLNLAIKYLDINNIGIIHVNHKKRLESDIEEEYIKEYANKLHINIYIKELDKYNGNNFQEWAREKRYEFFKEIYDKYNYDYLLLAHHADDNLETILMRLIKGSSIEGYSGIKEESIYKGMNIYRPFIKTPKEVLINYAKNNNLKYFEDDSNNHDDYLRNRIRHNIVPEIKKENSNIYNSINYYSESLSYLSSLVKKQVDEFNKTIIIYQKETFNIYKIDYSLYNKLDDYIKKEVLFTLLKKYQFSINTINEFINQFKKRKLINKVNDTLMIIKEYNYVKIIDGIYINNDIYLKIDNDTTINLNNGIKLNIKKSDNINSKNKKIYYNIDTLYVNKYPIIIRNRLNGDIIEINKQHKKISDILTNLKINYLDRNCYVVIDDENIDKVIIYNLERGS